MRNQVDYFEKCIKILKDLKKDYPDVEISKHYSLATDCGNFLSDKELFQALQRHQGEMEMNTVSNQEADEIIQQTEELFQEIEPDDEDDWQVEDSEEL